MYIVYVNNFRKVQSLNHKKVDDDDDSVESTSVPGTDTARPHPFSVLIASNNYRNVYTVFQKSDAKIQITITAAYLIRIKYPLSSFNYHLSDVNTANFNKIHRTVSEQQLF